MKKLVAVLLTLSMAFGFTACRENQETELESIKGAEGVFNSSMLYGDWTLNMIMPEDYEDKTIQIRLEADQLIVISDDGNETNYDYTMDEEYLRFDSTTDDTYYEGTYSVIDENIMELCVENCQIPETVLGKMAEFTNVGETDSGYTGSTTLTFYDAVRNPESSFSHPADGSATVELPSGEENYYLLPFAVTIKNTSEGFNVPARLVLSARENKNIIGGCKDYGIPSQIGNTVSNINIRVFYYLNQTWDEDSNDMLPASPYFSQILSWDSLGGNQEFRVLGYLLITDVVSPKYPDGLPWYIYPSIDVSTGFYLDNQWAVGSDVVIVKKDDGSATGYYLAVNTSDSDELEAIWENSREMLKSLKK